MRKMKYFFLCLLVLLVFKLHAQTAISGQVINAKTFAPVENVNVQVLIEKYYESSDDFGMPMVHSIKLPLKKTYTNTKGQFLLDTLSEGSVLIIFFHEDFEDFQQTLTLKTGMPSDFMVLLTPIEKAPTPKLFSIVGTVHDAETMAKIENAHVIIESYPDVLLTTPQKTLTNNHGDFNFHNIETSYVILTVEHDDFTSFSDILDLSTGMAQDIMILLKRNKIINLPTVVITEQKIERTPYISNTTLAYELENKGISDVGDVLRSIPNVGGIRRGGANIDPVVRGFKYSQLNVIINGAQGVEGGCPNRMDPATSRVEVEDIERIEVYKGPYALRFGTGLGGTINLVAKRPYVTNKPSISLKGIRGYESNWNGHKEHLSVQGVNENAFFLLSGSRWNYGNYQNGNGDFIKSAFNKHNYGGVIGGNYKDKYEFIFSLRQSFHKVLFPALPMDEVYDNSLLTFTEYKYTPNGKLLKSVSLKGYQSDIHHVMDNKNRPFSDTVATVSDVKALTTGIKTEAELNLFKGTLLAGLDYETRKKHGKRTKNMIMQPTAPVKEEWLWKYAVIDNFGSFIEYQKVFKNYELIIASRFDHNTATSLPIALENNMGNTILDIEDTDSRHNNFSFSAGLTRHFKNNFSLSLAAGRVKRSPDMLERFIILLPVGFDPYDYMGNPQLEPEINNQVDLTLRHHNEIIGGFEVNIFYALVENFIYGRLLPPSVQMPFTIGVLGVKEFYNADLVSLKGFEFAYKTPEVYSLQLHATAAYTNASIEKVNKYIRQNNQVTGDTLLLNDPLNEIPPLEGNIRISYNLFNKRFVPFAGLRLVAAQNKVSEAMYEATTPGFALINAGFSYKHNDFVQLNSGVNNILNLNYYEHLNRRMIGSAGKLYEPGRIFYINLIFNL